MWDLVQVLTVIPSSSDYSPAQLEKSSLVSKLNLPKFRFEPFDTVFQSGRLKLAAIRPLTLDVLVLANNNQVAH